MMEELQFQLDQVTFQLDEQHTKHAEAVAQLRDEAKQLQKRMLAVISRNALRAQGGSELGDNTFVRRVEWRVPDYDKVREKPRNEAIWSIEFAALGVQGIQLEFFPQGRETTRLAGFCALFLWCPVGVKVKYRLRVGSHWSAPDEDEYVSRMGHGHSNFCLLDAQKDEATNSVLVGVEILSIAVAQDIGMGLRLINQAPEALVARETAVVHNRQMDRVEWKIRDIRKRAKEVPRGLAICSPVFSISGVREMLLEFYPNGISMPDGKEFREGFCGFYVRASKSYSHSAGGLTLLLTLFVGDARKGPIKTQFDGNAAKGLPEFCRLADQLHDEDTDLLVGVHIQNPELEVEKTTIELGLEH